MSSFQLRGRGNTRLVQQEAFTVCIRNNVREYDGGDICLKEQLTNADDAKAKHFLVCLDKTQYGSRSLMSDGMASLQGPAVILFNDAKFSEADWHNYTRKVGDSSKADDPDTAGKFGKGALTAYYVTDVIQVLSGDNLLVLDPHGTYLPEHLRSWGCNLVSRDSHHFVDLAREASGQLDPFAGVTASCMAVPGLTTRSHYPGTLFRLALRSKAAAKASDISSESIEADQFEQILDEFAAAAPDLLLFLRHVTKISVYIKEDGQHTATLKHQCEAAVQRASTGLQQTFTVHIEKADSSKCSRTWLKIIDPAKNGDGIATLLQDSLCEHLPSLDGKVYSTMALPFENTGLPVHINGAFFVSSDRRNLWEGEGDNGKVCSTLILDNMSCAFCHLCLTCYLFAAEVDLQSCRVQRIGKC